MSYNPRERGARCDLCPLNGAVPVPPELRPGATAILVGEGPAEEEEKSGAPFVGRSGAELERGLLTVGVRRRAVSITNAVLCPLPGYSMTRARAEWEKENRARKQAGEPPRPSAVECCAPRLRRDLKDGGPNVIALGGTAIAAIGIQGSPLALRGGPREIEVSVPGEGPLATIPLRVMPTVHPAFVLHAQRWRRAFRADLGRAFRWFGSGLAWQDPEILYAPTADELREWLEARAGTAAKPAVVVYNLETFPGYEDSLNENIHFDPRKDRPTYIGLGDASGRFAVGIPLWSFDRRELWAPKSVLAPVLDVLRAFFVDPRFLKAGQNIGYYDRQVIERCFKVTPAPAVDILGLHKLVEPELPHKLGYIGSIYTDAPAWKEDFDTKAVASDAAMKRYNSIDVAVPALALPQLVRAVREREQERAARFWPFVQSVCVELHQNGMLVDQPLRGRRDLELRRVAAARRKQIRELTGLPSLNPNSTQQLRALFFDSWGLQPWGDPTEGGEPSTNDDTLRAFLGPSYDLDERRKVIVRAIRRFRAVSKMRGTYVVKLRPFGTPLTLPELAYDADEESEDREKRIAALEDKSGLVVEDGRVHGDYHPGGTVGWRLSSSGPNMQNFPDDLRDMIIAPPGYVFVGCDEAQLELRMAAALSGSKVYLDAFNSGEDPHAQLCIDFFGDVYLKAKPAQKKKLRRFVKEFTYASAYRAGPETVHSVLTASEGFGCTVCGEDLGGYFDWCKEHPTAQAGVRLLYPDLSLRDTVAFHRKWLDRVPEFEWWWERDLEEFRRQKYLAEPIFGLRRDFLDGENPNDIANLKCQSGGSALVHLATKIVMPELPKYRAKLVQQGHDSLVAEVPEEHGKAVAKMMEEAMTMDGREYGLPVKFLGEAKIGRTWKEV